VGEYKCIAENINGEKSVQKFYAEIDEISTDPPTIRVTPKEITVDEGSNLIINFTYTVTIKFYININRYNHI